MSGETLSVCAGGCRAVTDVDRDGQVARAEVAAPGVAALLAGDAWRVDPAAAPGQPRIEHDALAGVRAAPDDFVAEEEGERHQKSRERIIGGGAVEQDLFAHPSRTGREGQSPPAPSRHREVGVLRRPRCEPARARGDPAALIDSPADGRGGLTGKIVLEYERLHVYPLRRGANLPRR